MTWLARPAAPGAANVLGDIARVLLNDNEHFSDNINSVSVGPSPRALPPDMYMLIYVPFCEHDNISANNERWLTPTNTNTPSYVHAVIVVPATTLRLSFFFFFLFCFPYRCSIYIFFIRNFVSSSLLGLGLAWLGLTLAWLWKAISTWPPEAPVYERR